MAAQDAGKPWVFDTRELARRPGSMRPFSRVVSDPDPVGTDVIAIAPGQPVRIEGRMESVLEGVLISGSVQATATGMCVRCLDDVELDLNVAFGELFAYPERAERHRQVDPDGDTDQRVLEEDQIDLEDTLRDAVVTALPFQPLCRDDCPGLCPECGVALAREPDHAHETIDPRWSTLAHLATRPGTDQEKRN